MSDEEHKGLMIFGRDVSRIPCFRNSFLYGISSGIAGGLVCFLFTSRPRISCHWGMTTFTVVTLAYWIRCRYNYSKVKFEMMRMQELLKYNQMYEGTESEKELNRQLEFDSKDA